MEGREQYNSEAPAPLAHPRPTAPFPIAPSPFAAPPGINALTMPPDASHLWPQIAWLLIGAIPIAAVAWTVTHEEVFRELHDYCLDRSQGCRRLASRKFFYLFTCEYCFSHYVAAGYLLLTRFRLLIDDWRGYLIAGFALVYVANAYMSLYARLRVDITSERAIAKANEKIADLNEANAKCVSRRSGLSDPSTTDDAKPPL